jgi:ribosomal protein S17E
MKLLEYFMKEFHFEFDENDKTVIEPEQLSRRLLLETVCGYSALHQPFVKKPNPAIFI